MIPFFIELARQFRVFSESLLPEVGGASVCDDFFGKVDGVTSVFKIANLGKVSSTDRMDGRSPDRSSFWIHFTSSRAELA